MRVLLYSSVFWPSLGGVETISATLADRITHFGHDCTVVTETPAPPDGEEPRPYAIVRRPTCRQRLALARASDIIHANGASVALYPFAVLAGKPFVWTHNGYQVSCVDGAGWIDGEPAPMTPWASLAFYLQRRGPLYALKEAIKLAFRRFVAYHVDLNIAATQWVARRQPLPRQVQAYTPYALAPFRHAPPPDPHAKTYDFLYVGRLVSEKGVSDLLQAFARTIAHPERARCTLAIVGDGNLRDDLKAQAQQLGIAGNVDFLGAKRGSDLVRAMVQGRIAIVPSTWEEPMGGVSLELLAAGRVPIVSARGGHAECVGEAGLTFPNGDVSALHACMVRLLTDPDLVAQLRARAPARVAAFDEDKLAGIYLDLYQQAIERRTRSRSTPRSTAR